MAWVRVTPGGPGDLAFGYTLTDLDRIARSAASHAGWVAGDYLEVVHTAWSAIVEHLYSVEHPPPEHDLWHCGRHAIWDAVKSERRFHGAPVKDRAAGWGEMPSFRRYWWEYSTVVPSCEEKVVEREALAQIWPELTEVQQEGLLAFAAHGNVERAAAALGITIGAMNSRLQKARKRCLELWHDGETPSRKWRMDSGPRRTKNPLRPCGTASAYMRHRRRKEPMDDACRAAWTAYQAERVDARAVAVAPARTRSGARAADRRAVAA